MSKDEFKVKQMIYIVLYCTKRYAFGLSNELLFIIIAQGAAKLLPVKIGGRKESTASRDF